MDPVISKALIILFAPLAAFVVQIFFGRFLPRRGDWVPILAILVGAVLSLSIFLGPGGVMSEENGMTPVSWEINWFTIGSGTQQLRVDFGITVDNLTAMMLVVVTCIGSCIFFFSTGYMKEHGVPHARYHRFFAYLALFAFSMLGLILVNHLVFLFIFWELVGVCSYFLIGYYFEKKSAQDAANKAFLVNRVGDFGFFIGILVIFYCLGKSGLYENPLSFSALMDSVQNQHAAVWADPVFFGLPALAFAGIALFFGAVGKSAQVPLHVWLPDAMEGPTPVSALIHAATMVAAGVYMVARLFPFFAGPGFFVGDAYSSTALTFIAMIGSVTALMAATIAVAQYDIKKVLAYSTLSQLGFMMIGLGVGSITAGMFHLFTHAFFKALLFLGSGAVIYACHHEQDMRKMGGLRKKLPITHLTFLIGTLAIAGVPFLSGFWSKEGILIGAFALGKLHGGIYYLPFVCGALAAFLTAFYMIRLLGGIFYGEAKDAPIHDHAHEVPWVMAIPLCLLAVVSVIGGGVGVPLVAEGTTKWFEHRVSNEQTEAWVTQHNKPELRSGLDATPRADIALAAGGGAHDKVYRSEIEEKWHHAEHAAHVPVLLCSLAIAGGGIFLGWFLFIGPGKSRDPVASSGGLQRIQTVLTNLYYFDNIYFKTFFAGVHWLKGVCFGFDKRVVDFLVNLSAFFVERWSWFAGKIDSHGVDGSVRLTGDAVLYAGDQTRRTQTGRLQEYVSLTVILLGLLFFVWVVAYSYLP